MSSSFAGEYSSSYFAQFAAILQVRNREHQLAPINFDSSLVEGFFFGRVFRAWHCAPHGFALVRIELLLNSRLPELTRVGRERSMARFTNPQRRDVADSFQDPKAALSHDHSFPHRRKPRHPGPCGDGRLARPSRAQLGRADATTTTSFAGAEEGNRTFSVFMRHCAACRPRASLPSCFGNSY